MIPATAKHPLSFTDTKGDPFPPSIRADMDEGERHANHRCPSALVVDDVALVAEFLGSVLEEMGFRAVKAYTVADALKEARATVRFAVMFIDLGLPDRSGLELIEELKELQPGVPVVIATGYRRIVERDIAEGNSIPHYLIKPYNTESIAQVLRDIGVHSQTVAITNYGVLAFRMDGVRRQIEVLKGPLGFYLGTCKDQRPYSRESAEHWPLAEEAQAALSLGEWTQRLAD